MKSKFLKVISPVFAIMLAIVLSSFTVNEDSTTTGYIFIPGTGWQTVQVDCNDTAPDDCKVGNLIVYSQPDFSSATIKRTL